MGDLWALKGLVEGIFFLVFVPPSVSTLIVLSVHLTRWNFLFYSCMHYIFVLEDDVKTIGHCHCYAYFFLTNIAGWWFRGHTD